MKRAVIRAVGALWIAAFAAPSSGVATAGTESPATAWLGRLKALEGEWKGTTAKGKPATLSYKTIAGGTTVMEVFTFGEGQGAMSMYTMYHLDGDQLMLTHYCVSNNQPRMRAQLSSEEPNVLRFSFLDATNLAKPEDGHMYKAVLRILDDSHIANEWTYRKDGKDAFTEAVRYERVK